ncbi:transcription-repair coupling factor [Christensenellaceae bacterium OttesenSCG-928-M15]|nr:transcription-repair coupling factor [Christensenellaceae bacterium OttesenSCG-928-M15]
MEQRKIKKQADVSPLITVLKELPEYNRLLEILEEGEGPVAAFSLPEAQRAHVFAAIAQQHGGLFIAATEQSAKALYAQASAFTDRVAYLNAREIPLVNAYAVSGAGAQERIATLMRLALGEKVGVIASAASAMQALAPPEVLKNAIHTLKIGETRPPQALRSALFDAGYEMVELVEGAGQVSLRGDILDVYPPHAQNPYRIEFFDDEIDRMSVYDAITQRSIDRIEEVTIPPATEAPQDKGAIARAKQAIGNAAGFDAIRIAYEENRPAFGVETLIPVLYEGMHSIFDHVGKGAFVFVEELHRVEEEAKGAQRLFHFDVQSMLERGEGVKEQIHLQMDADTLIEKLNSKRTALFYTLARSNARIRPKESVQFDARVAPLYTNDRAELARDLMALRHNQQTAILFAGKHAERLHQQLLDEGLEAALSGGVTRAPVHGEVWVVKESLPIGMLYPSLKLTVLTEAELFGIARGPKRKRHAAGERIVFSELKPGDLVVHEAHGIGRFIGVEALTVQDTKRDYLLMEYAGSDRLYIPTDQLDRVQKYIGGDEAPRLSKLGGSEWQRQVTKAKNAVKELAFDLAQLYAARENSAGFAFSKDSPWQRQLEEKFQFLETPDQQRSIEEIKRDMESAHVMDRLLCGDVGYGKTEVALRAAFKAVQDSKQVAFLVPTTILAQQHYNTLSTRFAGFPVKVALLSRFKTAQEIKKIKEDLAAGRVDVVIGTHALLAKDVKFKDLGLLVIDEEQRFGVGHKEQIKTLKNNVDVLTLTATPIPRTLHMSMIGIRDMSVIDTPPEERFPVQTYVLEYSDTVLRDALSKEIGRGGQCYIVYNQVRKLDQYREHILRLLPEARVAIAHGQMSETVLEQVMLDFMEHRYDALLCSTIVENGLDIPNANTMIVIEADKMGLSQLYQLRGRVGRSTRLGYAYFTFQRNKVLSEIAHKRLSALTEFAQFGAGREIALRDLEIRGAGSLLGAQQHGHIADIGYEYYCKLMGKAVQEARDGEAMAPPVDTVVDIPLDAHIPKDYIRSEVQRLSMYKRVAMIDDQDALLDVQEELEDRYGDIPIATQNLMDVSLIKAAANHAQVTSLTLREESAKLIFHEEAALDGALLVRAAGEFGAQLLPGETVSLLLKKKNASVKDMIKAVHPLLVLLG